MAKEPIIWSSSGGSFEFSVQVNMCGRPNAGDIEYFEETMKLALIVLRRAAKSQRFSGFDGISTPPQDQQ